MCLRMHEILRLWRVLLVHRKIPRDLTEASLSGAGLSILAALVMVFLFGMVCSGDGVFFLSIVCIVV
jgi:hypothetical protein